MLQDNISAVMKRVEDACLRVGRNSSEIKVVAVTKFVDEKTINQAIDLGITTIAENRAQEIKRKHPKIKPVSKHMIGVMQTNKVKMIIDLVDMIQSVDRKSLMEEINKRAAESKKVMDVLIQVNIAKEEQKSGVRIEHLEELIQYASNKENIRVRGLMAIMPDIEDEFLLRNYFSEMKKVFDQYAKRETANVKMDYLSMGMSGDFEIAIEEGANMIRIGSALFQE